MVFLQDILAAGLTPSGFNRYDYNVMMTTMILGSAEFF